MPIVHFRRVSSGVIAALVALSWSGLAFAVGTPTVTAAVGVPTPNAGAPSGTTFDLALEGYQASEFFVEGTASSYHNASGPPFTADGLWTVEPDAAPTPAYKTRIQVYRPIDPEAFSGVVIVEWLNVTNQSDSAADWIIVHNELIRQGHVYVGATTQAIGVNAARTLDTARYGAAGANLVHPGDSYSYDIFSQIAKGIRENQALVLGGLTLEKMIADGESQSATRMVTYIDALSLLDGMYDGYYVHSRGTNGAALRAAIAGPPALTAIATPGTTLIRTDMTQPVFILQSETDSRATRQPDTGVFRQWESAGSTHADMYTLGIGQPDHGQLDTTGAERLFTRMLNPTNDPLPGILPPCGLPVNSGPHHWVVQSSLHHLVAWVQDATLPPASQYLTTVTTPTSALVLDANGNVTGGVRSPHVDTPIATIRGSGQPPSNLFCSLFGTTTPFTQTQFLALYADEAAFKTAWDGAVDNAVANGFVLADDEPKLKLPEPGLTVSVAAGLFALGVLRRRKLAARG